MTVWSYAVDMDNETIGATVRDLRGVVSQKDLAQAMRTRGHRWSQTTVWLVETGERPLRLTEAVAVADALNVPLPALLGTDPDAAQADAAEVLRLRQQITQVLEVLA